MKSLTLILSIFLITSIYCSVESDAVKTIPDYLKIEPGRSLILINTVSGAEEFVKSDLAYYFDYIGSEWDYSFSPQYDKPTVMTYALFGAKYKFGES